jgi:hypothetical protein
MNRVKIKTLICNNFHINCKKWFLGVLYIYNAIVFGQTPIDTTISSNVSQYGLNKTPLDTTMRFSTILTKGGVYSD